MKRTTKIGIAIAIVGLVGLLISTTVNIWIKALVCRQLDQNIATADSLVISYDNIRVAAFRGKAWIKDVHFCSDTAAWSGTDETMVDARVDVLSLDGINYFNWLAKRQLNLKGLTVIHPVFRMRFIHKPKREQEGDVLQEQLAEERKKRLENILRVARIFIDDATLNRLTIDRADIHAESINDSLRVEVPEFTMSIYDLGYNIKDSVPHYNDSIFHFLIRNVNVNIPEGPMSLTVNELKASPNGILDIKDVWIKSYLNPNLSESVVAGVEQVSVGGFDVAKFNKEKQMNVKNIHLYNPKVALRIDESNQQTDLQSQSQTQVEVEAINKKLAESKWEVATDYITGLTVDTILFHNAKMNVQSIATDFYLQASNLSMALYGVGGSLIDQIPYHYNDSVYQFYLGNVDIITPDSFIAISSQNIHYDNGGSFSVGKTRIHHIINKWKLAHKMGDIPVSLIDMKVDTIRTSSKNIVKEALTLQGGFFLDSVYAEVSQLNVFRDARYQIKEPYVLPQTYICQLSYPFVVNCVNAKIDDIHIEMALTKKDIGRLNLGPIDLKINNVTPIPNSIIRTSAHGKMGKADIDAVFKMKVNKACNWSIVLDAKNMNAHHLDNMIYPIVGMKIGCDFHRIHAEYGGDTALATGTFCMEYDNVDIFADKNSNPPITMIKDVSGLINSAGKTIVHKSNPTNPGEEPIAYQVKWKNNPWVNPALFYIGPVIDGCIETMLPGLFVHKRVKNKKTR